MKGYLSIVIPINSKLQEGDLTKFLNNLSKIEYKYEVILCVSYLAEKYIMAEKLTKIFSNIAVYEVFARDIDSVISHGLEIALGDWVFELVDSKKLIEHFQALLSKIESLSDIDQVNIIISPNKIYFRDKVLLTVNKVLTDIRVITFLNTSRVSSRNSLMNWNRRAFKNKVLRIAPFVNSPSTKQIVIKDDNSSNYNSLSLFKIGMRTIIYSSIRPLRFISSISLFGAVLSTLYSLYIVLIKYQDELVPGWASTNLLISTFSLSVLVILSVISEYLYQLVGIIVQSSSSRITREALSAKYSFKEVGNVEKDVSVEKW
jgi:hypothetical protein